MSSIKAVTLIIVLITTLDSPLLGWAFECFYNTQIEGKLCLGHQQNQMLRKEKHCLCQKESFQHFRQYTDS